MNADEFTTAARAEAEERWPHGPNRSQPLSHRERMDRRAGFDLGAQWARDHLARQEATDAEARAATDAVRELLTGQTARPLGMGYQEFATVKASRIARAALTAAKGARA